MERRLPPEQWIHERAWGRDIVHFAHNEIERLEYADFLMDSSSEGITTEDVIVMRYLLETGEDKSDLVRKAAGEADIAALIMDYVEGGSRAFSFSSESLTSAAREDVKSAEAVDIDAEESSMYLSFDDLPGTTAEGDPIDGFMISHYWAEDKRVVEIQPMSRDLPEDFSVPKSSYIVLPGDPRGLADQMRDWPKTIDSLIADREGQVRDISEGEDEDDARRTALELKKAHVQEMRDRRDVIVGNMTSNVDAWAQAIIAAFHLMATAPGRPCYDAHADGAFAAKALSGKPGARKAMQKLVAAGYQHMTRYDDKPADDAIADATPKNGTDAPSVLAPTNLPAGTSIGRDKRQKKRTNKRDEQHEPQAAVRTSQPVSSERKPESVPPLASQETKRVKSQPPRAKPTAEEMDDAVDLDIESILHRCMRDLPSLTSRNWQEAVSMAMAGLAVRRLRIPAAPRESEEAVRRRIAADVSQRIESLPSSTAERQAAGRKATTDRNIGGISTNRPPDPDVTDMFEGLVRLEVDDEQLAIATAFPGIVPGAGNAHAGKWRLIVLIHCAHGRLEMEALLYEGCLAGYRRAVLDPKTGAVEGDESEGDESASQEFADRCYAALADFAYGPVELSDAWQHERDYELYRSRTRPRAASAQDPGPAIVPPTITITKTAESMPAPRAERAPSPSTHSFDSWANLTIAPVGDLLGTADEAEIIMLSSENAASNRLVRDMVSRTIDDDISRAWRRHACAIVGVGGQLNVIEAPHISDDADLTGCDGRRGILVVRDRAFFEHAPGNLVEGPSAPGKAFVVFYAVGSAGASAMTLQSDDEEGLRYAHWGRVSIAQQDDEEDYAWYMRSILAQALRPDLATIAKVPEAALYDGRRFERKNEGMARQGARRIIAQTRLHPNSMAEAVAVVERWFDEQVERHGENLIADRRESGEWTIEHVSHDRGTTSLWSVTIRNPGDVQSGLDIIVQTTLATGVKPRLPTIVRRIAEATPTRGPDGLLRTSPEYVKTKGEALDLVRRLLDPERRLPVLMMTQDRDGTYMRDPSEVAAQSLGALTVVKVSEQMTYELSDALGQEYRTFFGAVRLFQPGFDPDRDPASRHPRIMPDSMADRSLADMISRVTAATITRYDIPSPLQPTPSLPARITAEAPPPSAPQSVPAARPTVPIAEVPRPIDAVAPIDDQDEAGHLPPSDEQAEAVEVAEQSSIAIDAVPPLAGANEDGDETADEEHDAPGPSAASPPDHGNDNEPDAVAMSREMLRKEISDVLDEKLGSHGLSTLRADMAGIVALIQSLGDSIGTPARGEPAEQVEQLQKELKAERESLTQLLDEADAERRAALAEVQTLRQALNDRRRHASPLAQAYPKDLSGLSEWLETNVLPNVVVTTKAWRNMRKVDYRDMERLCETLKLLDGPYIDMRAGEDGGREQWVEGLERLRLQDKKQTIMGVSAREGDYHFTHQGETYLMDRHLRGAESLYNDHQRLLRIYYHYDAEQRRVLIGHMPTHLTTKDS